MLQKTIIVFFFLLLNTVVFCQKKDSIKLGNEQVLIGSIESLDKSVLVFKTSYSDSDFKIKWWRVKEIYSNQTFILTLADGRRFNSSINTDSINKKQVVLFDHGEKILTEINKITSLDPFESSFFQRLEVAFGAGLSLTKANNFSQVTGNAKIDYKGINWNFLTALNFVYSKQDDTDNIRRYEADITLQRFLPKEWFLQSSLDFLSNSDQQLDLRTTGSLGAGYFFVKNNNLYFGVGTGLAFNNEVYTDATDSKSSLESYFGAEFNKYDIGDLSLLASATLFPSITEKGRIRFDSNFSLKYDLTSRLYLKSTISYNFDNQPVEGSPNADYTFQTTIGWDND
jgi:putative salt-induced outer membrane protein YdiY